MATTFHAIVGKGGLDDEGEILEVCELESDAVRRAGDLGDTVVLRCQMINGRVVDAVEIPRPEAVHV